MYYHQNERKKMNGIPVLKLNAQKKNMKNILKQKQSKNSKQLKKILIHASIVKRYQLLNMLVTVMEAISK